VKKTGLLFAALLASNIAQANGELKNMTREEKEQVAWAIQVLIKSKVLRADEKQCMQFDQSIIDTLQKEGLLSEEDAKPMTICVGPSI